MAELQLTEKAADIFKHLITEEGDTTNDTYLLVGANSGGCSGYKFFLDCLLYTSPSPRDRTSYRMPSSA